LSNAASLLLPVSNLTNLIVLGHLHLTGGQFAARMWLPWLGAVAVTAAVVAIGERRSLGPVRSEPGRASRPVLGIGLAAIIAATALVIVIRSAALPVFVIGALAVGVRLRGGGQVTIGRIWQVLGMPVLVGPFGAAVALGTLGRAWSGPAVLLSHLSGLGDGSVRRRSDGRGEQPSGRQHARGQDSRSSAPATDRPQSRTEPVRHGLARLAAVAPVSSGRRGAPVTGPR
jgi:hypothetical protein